MKNAIKYFFTAQNKIKTIETADYTNFFNIIEMAKAFSDSTGFGVYIIDYYNCNIPYISDNLFSWCDFNTIKTSPNIYDMFLSYIPLDDIKMLIDINNAAFDFFENKLSKNSKKFTLSYDFKFGDIMVHQIYKPLLLKDNKIWIATCIVYPSSKKRHGNIILNADNRNFEYSVATRIWKSQKPITLSDKEILIIIHFLLKKLLKKHVLRKYNKSTKKDTIQKIRCN